MIYVYGIFIVIALVLLKRMIKIVPADSVCIIEKKLRYHRTLKPGAHIIMPLYSKARIVPVEKRKGPSIKDEITFADSSRKGISAIAVFLLWDPYTPFFTFENLDHDMSSKAMEQLKNIALHFSPQEFEKDFDAVKQQCLDALNTYGKEYGIEFISIEIS